MTNRVHNLSIHRGLTPWGQTPSGLGLRLVAGALAAALAVPPPVFAMRAEQRTESGLEALESHLGGPAAKGVPADLTEADVHAVLAQIAVHGTSEAVETLQAWLRQEPAPAPLLAQAGPVAESLMAWSLQPEASEYARGSVLIAAARHPAIRAALLAQLPNAFKTLDVSAWEVSSRGDPHNTARLLAGFKTVEALGPAVGWTNFWGVADPRLVSLFFEQTPGAPVRQATVRTIGWDGWAAALAHASPSVTVQEFRKALQALDTLTTRLTGAQSHDLPPLARRGPSVGSELEFGDLQAELEARLGPWTDLDRFKTALQDYDELLTTARPLFPPDPYLPTHLNLALTWAALTRWFKGLPDIRAPSGTPSWTEMERLADDSFLGAEWKKKTLPQLLTALVQVNIPMGRLVEELPDLYSFSAYRVKPLTHDGWNHALNAGRDDVVRLHVSPATTGGGHYWRVFLVFLHHVLEHGTEPEAQRHLAAIEQMAEGWHVELVGRRGEPADRAWLKRVAEDVDFERQPPIFVYDLLRHGLRDKFLEYMLAQLPPAARALATGEPAPSPVAVTAVASTPPPVAPPAPRPQGGLEESAPLDPHVQAVLSECFGTPSLSPAKMVAIVENALLHWSVPQQLAFLHALVWVPDRDRVADLLRGMFASNSHRALSARHVILQAIREDTLDPQFMGAQRRSSRRHGEDETLLVRQGLPVARAILALAELLGEGTLSSADLKIIHHRISDYFAYALSYQDPRASRIVQVAEMAVKEAEIRDLLAEMREADPVRHEDLARKYQELVEQHEAMIHRAFQVAAPLYSGLAGLHHLRHFQLQRHALERDNTFSGTPGEVARAAQSAERDLRDAYADAQRWMSPIVNAPTMSPLVRVWFLRKALAWEQAYADFLPPQHPMDDRLAPVRAVEARLSQVLAQHQLVVPPPSSKRVPAPLTPAAQAALRTAIIHNLNVLHGLKARLMQTGSRLTPWGVAGYITVQVSRRTGRIVQRRTSRDSTVPVPIWVTPGYRFVLMPSRGTRVIPQALRDALWILDAGFDGGPRLAPTAGLEERPMKRLAALPKDPTRERRHEWLKHMRFAALTLAASLLHNNVKWSEIAAAMTAAADRSRIAPQVRRVVGWRSNSPTPAVKAAAWLLPELLAVLGDMVDHDQVIPEPKKLLSQITGRSFTRRLKGHTDRATAYRELKMSAEDKEAAALGMIDRTLRAARLVPGRKAAAQGGLEEPPTSPSGPPSDDHESARRALATRSQPALDVLEQDVAHLLGLLTGLPAPDKQSAWTDAVFKVIHVDLEELEQILRAWRATLNTTILPQIWPPLERGMATVHTAAQALGDGRPVVPQNPETRRLVNALNQALRDFEAAITVVPTPPATPTRQFPWPSEAGRVRGLAEFPPEVQADLREASTPQARVEVLMQHAGPTNTELTKAAGLSPHPVARWRQRGVEMPSATSIHSISRALGVDPLFVVTGASEAAGLRPGSIQNRWQHVMQADGWRLQDVAEQLGVTEADVGHDTTAEFVPERETVFAYAAVLRQRRPTLQPVQLETGFLAPPQGLFQPPPGEPLRYGFKHGYSALERDTAAVLQEALLAVWRGRGYPVEGPGGWREQIAPAAPYPGLAARLLAAYPGTLAKAQHYGMLAPEVVQWLQRLPRPVSSYREWSSKAMAQRHRDWLDEGMTHGFIRRLANNLAQAQTEWEDFFKVEREGYPRPEHVVWRLPYRGHPVGRFESSWDLVARLMPRAQVLALANAAPVARATLKADVIGAADPEGKLRRREARVAALAAQFPEFPGWFRRWAAWRSDDEPGILAFLGQARDFVRVAERGWVRRVGKVEGTPAAPTLFFYRMFSENQHGDRPAVLGEVLKALRQRETIVRAFLRQAPPPEPWPTWASSLSALLPDAPGDQRPPAVRVVEDVLRRLLARRDAGRSDRLPPLVERDELQQWLTRATAAFQAAERDDHWPRTGPAYDALLRDIATGLEEEYDVAKAVDVLVATVEHAITDPTELGNEMVFEHPGDPRSPKIYPLSALTLEEFVEDAPRGTNTGRSGKDAPRSLQTVDRATIQSRTQWVAGDQGAVFITTTADRTYIKPPSEKTPEESPPGGLEEPMADVVRVFESRWVLDPAAPEGSRWVTGVVFDDRGAINAIGPDYRTGGVTVTLTHDGQLLVPEDAPAPFRTAAARYQTRLTLDAIRAAAAEVAVRVRPTLTEIETQLGHLRTLLTATGDREDQMRANTIAVEKTMQMFHRLSATLSPDRDAQLRDIVAGTHAVVRQVVRDAMNTSATALENTSALYTPEEGAWLTLADRATLQQLILLMEKAVTRLHDLLDRWQRLPAIEIQFRGRDSAPMLDLDPPAEPVAVLRVDTEAVAEHLHRLRAASSLDTPEARAHFQEILRIHAHLGRYLGALSVGHTYATIDQSDLPALNNAAAHLAWAHAALDPNDGLRRKDVLHHLEEGVKRLRVLLAGNPSLTPPARGESGLEELSPLASPPATIPAAVLERNLAILRHPDFQRLASEASWVIALDALGNILRVGDQATTQQPNDAARLIVTADASSHLHVTGALQDGPVWLAFEHGTLSAYNAGAVALTLDAVHHVAERLTGQINASLTVVDGFTRTLRQTAAALRAAPEDAEALTTAYRQMALTSPLIETHANLIAAAVRQEPSDLVSPLLKATLRHEFAQPLTALTTTSAVARPLPAELSAVDRAAAIAAFEGAAIRMRQDARRLIAVLWELQHLPRLEIVQAYDGGTLALAAGSNPPADHGAMDRQARWHAWERQAETRTGGMVRTLTVLGPSIVSQPWLVQFLNDPAVPSTLLNDLVVWMEEPSGAFGTALQSRGITVVTTAGEVLDAVNRVGAAAVQMYTDAPRVVALRRELRGAARSSSIVVGDHSGDPMDLVGLVETLFVYRLRGGSTTAAQKAEATWLGVTLERYYL